MSRDDAQHPSNAPTAAMAPDRTVGWVHRAHRYRYEAEVRLVEPELSPPIEGTVRNLSPGGLFLETRRRLRLDTAIALDLPLEEGPLRLRGTVVWLRRQGRGGAPPGLGIRLEGLPEGDRLRFEMLLASLPVEEERPPGDGPELDYTLPES